MIKLKTLIFTLGIFLCMLDTTIMNVALPQISEAFNTPLNNLSWALNIYTILFASLTIPLTRIAEKFGMNRLIIIGFILFGIGSFVSGNANGLTQLISGRGIQSIGAALIFPLSMTLGINLVDKLKRTGIIALLGVTQGLAAALGPIIGGVITQYLSWRWIFYINIPAILLIISISLGVLDIKENRNIVSNFDFMGSTFSITFLLSLTTVLSQGRNWGWSSFSVIALTILTIVCFIIFILIELNSKKPMIPLALFKNKNFIGASLVIILSNLFLVAVTVILPTYYTNVKYVNALDAALTLVPITFFIFIVSPLAGFALKKFGAKILIPTGFILMMFGYFGYANNGLDNQLYSYLYGAFIGTGYGLITGPITVIAASNFTGELLSASQSVSGLLRQVGTVLAVAIYITGLYSNITISQNQSEQYVVKEIKKLNVPDDIKPILIEKSKKAIKSRTNTNIPTKHTGISEIDSKINNTLKNIKQQSQKNAINAFKKLYKNTIGFLLIVIIFMIFFWRRTHN